MNRCLGCEAVARIKPSGPCSRRNSILCTFSHSTEGVLVGLVGHPAHHVWHAHALLVWGIWSHRVPFWVCRITHVWEWVMHTDCTAPERCKIWKLNYPAALANTLSWRNKPLLYAKTSSTKLVKTNQGTTLFSIRLSSKKQNKTWVYISESPEHTFHFAWGSSVHEG